MAGFGVIGKEIGVVLVYGAKKWEEETPDPEKRESFRTGGTYDLEGRKMIDKSGVTARKKP